MEHNYNLIEKSFIDFLEKENGSQIQPSVDLQDVLNLLISENIPVKTHNKGDFTGLATLWGLYFNLNKLWRYPNVIKYYIILHEIGHVKRMRKHGEDKVLSDFSQNDFDKFAESVINEEIIADRYASFVYYRLTGNVLPKNYTQKLDLPEYQERYKGLLKSCHTNVDNDIESYKKELKNRFDIDV